MKTFWLSRENGRIRKLLVHPAALLLTLEVHDIYCVGCCLGMEKTFSKDVEIAKREAEAWLAEILESLRNTLLHAPNVKPPCESSGQ